MCFQHSSSNIHSAGAFIDDDGVTRNELNNLKQLYVCTMQYYPIIRVPRRKHSKNSLVEIYLPQGAGNKQH